VTPSNIVTSRRIFLTIDFRRAHRLLFRLLTFVGLWGSMVAMRRTVGALSCSKRDVSFTEKPCDKRSSTVVSRVMSLYFVISAKT
jgi:hypothetical protein